MQIKSNQIEMKFYSSHKNTNTKDWKEIKQKK